MVADDDPVHHALLHDLLKPLGFAVLSASDGAACLDQADAAACDLFLIDLSMPGMTGWDLAARLRERHPAVPIIIISADGRELKQPRAEPTHHDDALTKPINLTELLDRVGNLLHIEWTAADVPSTPAPGDRLSPAQLDTLRDLAAIGHVSGLRTQLDVLARESPGSHAHIAYLRSLLAGYELDAFLAAIPDTQGAGA